MDLEDHNTPIFTRELYSVHVSALVAEIIVLSVIAGGGQMTPPTSTRISARVNTRVLEYYV